MVLVHGITKKVGGDMLLILDKEDVKKYNIKAGQILNILRVYKEKPRL